VKLLKGKRLRPVLQLQFGSTFAGAAYSAVCESTSVWPAGKSLEEGDVGLRAGVL
jgi:hypothetical protein